jgi:hypothetical protein
MEANQHRRETDKFSNRFNRVAAIIGSAAVVGGAILAVGSRYFQTVEAAQCEKRESMARVERVEVRQIESDKTLVEINVTLKNISERVNEIKQDVRDIKRR